MIGKHKHVAVPCDEENDAGEPVRTWDVMRRGRPVASGYVTRREAREEARRLDADERDRTEWVCPECRGLEEHGAKHVCLEYACDRRCCDECSEPAGERRRCVGCTREGPTLCTPCARHGERTLAYRFIEYQRDGETVREHLCVECGAEA